MTIWSIILSTPFWAVTNPVYSYKQSVHLGKKQMHLYFCIEIELLKLVVWPKSIISQE